MSALFRPDRTGKASPHLEWRVSLLVAGAALGVAGIYLDEEWIRLVAIALLAAGVAVRFLRVGRSASEPGPTDEDDNEGGPA